MATYPREDLKLRDPGELNEACGVLSYEGLLTAIAHMDSQARGGVSAKGTVIAALIVRCHDLWIANKERGPL